MEQRLLRISCREQPRAGPRPGGLARDVDLRLVRLALALAAVVSLIWGFVWRSRGGVRPDPYDFLSGLCRWASCLRAVLPAFLAANQDALFLASRSAFALLGLGSGDSRTRQHSDRGARLAFLIRLAAFALILIAIVRKNRSADA